VKKGDTLSGIAKKTGVSLNTLYKLNNLNAKSKIYPGKKIRIK
jgi:LysM repeat protein